MIRKYISWLAVIFIMLLASCATPSNNESGQYDTDVSSEYYSDDTTVVTSDIKFFETQFPQDTSSDGIKNITSPQPNVMLEFIPYTAYDSILLPIVYNDCIQYDHKYINDIIVLGYNAECEVIKYQTNNGIYKQYIICTDIDTAKIFFRGEGSILDIDGDNNNEIKSNDYLLMDTDNGIMTANIKTAFDNYLRSILDKNTDYDFYLGFDSDYNLFSYTVYIQGEEMFEKHDIQIQYVENGFDFINDRSYFRNFYTPYESNDPNWCINVTFTDVKNPHGISSQEEYIYKLYTLNVLGPNDKQFAIYGNADFYLENAVSINTNEYQDARLDRKLVVHPNYDYAILMYPFAAETADAVSMTVISVIDLNTGSIVDSKSGIEEASFCLYNPYYIFECAEEASKELNKYDFLGNNIHTITQNIEVTDIGFKITVHLRESNGVIVKSTEFFVDLQKITTPAVQS